MTEKIDKNYRGLILLGSVTGILALLFFAAFYYTGESRGDVYYLGAFFTSLNVSVLCLCFSRVYELLAKIHEELVKRN